MKIKSISLKKLSYILIIVYILSIVPMLLIGLYNYPSADDFNMGVAAHRAMETSGALAAIAQGFVMAWYDYINWMGYFTSTVLMSVPPSVFSEVLYPMGIFIELAILTFATCYLLKALLHKMCGFDKDAVTCISMLVLIVSEQCMPGTSARVEMFYWYCSSANYLITYSLALIFLGLLINAVFEKNRKKRIVSYVLSILLSFWIGGANYMTALSCAIVIVLSFIWRQSVSKGMIKDSFLEIYKADTIVLKREKMIIVPGVLMLLGFAASCFAPGNNNRAESLTGMGPVKSILVSLHYTLSYPMSEWTNWAVIICFVIMGIIMWKAVSYSAYSFRYPLIAAAVGYGLVSANITPCLYAEGNIFAGRLQGLFWLQYVLIAALAEWYLVGMLYRMITGASAMKNRAALDDKHDAHDFDVSETKGKKECSDYSSDNRKTLGKNGTELLIILALFFLAGSALQTVEDHDYYTSTSAIEDLLNGHAQRYAEQNSERRQILNDPEIRNAELEAYEFKPDLLFFSDIDEDPGDWQNQGVKKYYNKESVVRLP